MPNLTLWSRRLRPAHLAGEARRIGKKVLRKIRRPERRVVTLEPAGEARGRALVSYIVDGLLVPPESQLPRGHTHFWESRQIARTFVDLGYTVDVIHWTNQAFEPVEPYDVLLDVRLNLERLAPSVGDACLKIQHIETAHYAFHNRAQQERLDALEERRGVRLAPRKTIEPNRAIETADFGIAVGNAFTIGTYEHAGTPIFRVPISVPCVYAAPEDKDFAACRRRFLWFGSGGLVHKGLDLVLEAFADMPEYELAVCGPIHMERDLEAAYVRELYESPNIRTLGWVDVAGERFRKLRRTTLGVVYPSCSEGGGGSVITCLHAGLLPIVTREASVDLHGFGTELPEASVGAIREAVREMAATDPSTLRDQAMTAWRHARTQHTRETFARDYRRVAERILSADGESDDG